MVDIIFNKPLIDRLPTAEQLYAEFKKQYAKGKFIKKSASSVWEAYRTIVLHALPQGHERPIYYEFRFHNKVHYVIIFNISDYDYGVFSLVVDGKTVTYQNVIGGGLEVPACNLYFTDGSEIRYFFRDNTSKITTNLKNSIVLGDDREITLNLFWVNSAPELSLKYNYTRKNVLKDLVISEGNVFLDMLGIDHIMFDAPEPFSNSEKIVLLDALEHEITGR